MNTSIFLAKLIGPFMVVLGLSLVANRLAFRRLTDEFLKSPALIFLTGTMVLPAGLAIVLAHNIWVAGWPVIITILGWMLIVSGVIRIMAPQRATKFAKKIHRMKDYSTAVGALWAVVGAVLCYFGYFS